MIFKDVIIDRICLENLLYIIKLFIFVNAPFTQHKKNPDWMKLMVALNAIIHFVKEKFTKMIFI